MTSLWFLRQGALHTHFRDGFWRSDHDFLIASHCNFYLGCMVFEIKWFYFKPYVTSSWFLRQGALHAIFWLRFWKGDPDFILVLYCYHTSIVHRFRFNELFKFAGNDVITISSLGGASGNFWLRILKGRPRLYIHVQATLFVYLERFRRYSTFFIWLEFPYWGRNFGGFWGKWPPKRQIREKTLAERALSYAKLRLLSHCAWNYLYPFGLRNCAKKGSKAGRKAGRSHKKCIFHVCVERPLAGGLQPNLTHVFVSRA